MLGYFSKPQDLTAELVAKDPRAALKIIERLRKSSQSTDIGKKIANAFSLQQQNSEKVLSHKSMAKDR